MLLQKPKKQIQIPLVNNQKDQSFVTQLYCRELFTRIDTKENLNLEINEFETPDDTSGLEAHEI